MKKIVVVLFLLLFLFGCTSTPPESEPSQAEETAPTPVEPEAAEPEVTEEPQTPETEPEESEPEEPTEPEDDFEVTEEVYEQTFDEVEQTIARLNTIIRQRDFEEWKSYLTEDYEEEYSDPATLQEWSETPLLERNEIVLRSLEDYFNYVVVPSRSNARLDDLEFVDENTVEAFMNVRGRRALLYLLQKVDGVWKIDTF